MNLSSIDISSPTLLRTHTESVISLWSFRTITFTSNITTTEYQMMDCFITGLDLLTYFCRLYVEFFGQALMLQGMFELLNATKTFTAGLKPGEIFMQKKTPDFLKVSRKTSALLDQWRDLKRFSNAINNVTDGMVFIFFILATSYVSGTFDQITRNAGWVEKVWNMQFLLVTGTLFGMSAQIVEEVKL